MNMHENARLTPKGREISVKRLERGERPVDVGCAMGVSTRTVYKWAKRFREQGLEALQGRSSRPAFSPAQTPPDIEARVIQLRLERRIMERIAEETGVSRATAGRILARHSLNRWRDLDPCEPVIRYERDTPGDMIHIDIKKLGKFSRTGHRVTDDRAINSRGAGWEFVHVCIDDHSRLGFSQVLASERKEDAIGFLKSALAWYGKLGIKVTRVMTDNGSCYGSAPGRGVIPTVARAEQGLA